MTTRERDLELWKQWNRTKSDADLQRLLDNLKPLIQQQVTRWGGSMPPALLETQAKILAVEAIRTYSPNRGAALATHVTNRLQKLSRTVYTHTQAARLPENKVISMASFSTVHGKLSSDLGRDPTIPELSDELGWSLKRTGEFNKAFQRQELLTSGEFNPSSFPVADEHDPVVGYVYYDMEPKKQKLFENITGYGGAPVLNNTQLKKKYDLTQGQLSYQKRKMTEMFETALKQRGQK